MPLFLVKACSFLAHCTCFSLTAFTAHCHRYSIIMHAGLLAGARFTTASATDDTDAMSWFDVPSSSRLSGWSPRGQSAAQSFLPLWWSRTSEIQQMLYTKPALLTKENALTLSGPYSRVPSQLKCSDWLPTLLSLHQVCPCTECPDNEVTVYACGSVIISCTAAWSWLMQL